MFPVVYFLKYIPTEVVLFSIVAFKTLTFHKVVRSVATHLRCGGIFSDSVIYKCSPDSDSEISLKIGAYLIRLWRMKLRRTKKVCQFFGPPCIVVRNIRPGSTQLSRYIVSRRHGPTFHKTMARILSVGNLINNFSKLAKFAMDFLRPTKAIQSPRMLVRP